MKVLCIDTGEMTNWRFSFESDEAADGAYDRIVKYIDRVGHYIGRVGHADFYWYDLIIAEGEHALIPLHKVKMIALMIGGTESPSHQAEKAYAVAKSLTDQDIERAVKDAASSKAGFHVRD